MWARFLLLIALIAFGGYGLVRLRTAAHTATPASEVTASDKNPSKIDFDTHVRPILNRCQPCHFSGGTMYAKLPFDRPETVRKLGEKLFTRIQKEDERKIIREFLLQDKNSKE
jgi:hypothetical protein